MSHIVRHQILGVDGSHDFGLKIGESRAIAVTEVLATEDGWELVYRLAPRPDAEKVFTITDVQQVVNSTERRYWKIKLEEIDPADQSGDGTPSYWAFVPIHHGGSSRPLVPQFAREQLEAAAHHGGPVPAFLRIVSRTPMATSRGPAERVEFQGALDLGPAPIQLSTTRWINPNFGR